MKLKEFLAPYGITMEKFRTLEPWKQDVWREQHERANREEQIAKSREERLSKISEAELEAMDAMQLLADIGVPFGTNGPVGIWDD